MSYDVYIEISTGIDVHLVEEVGNMTSNVGDMYRLAMPEEHENGGRYNGDGDPEPRPGLTGLSGLKCSEALPFIRNGVKAMEDRCDEMRALEPDNGWGTYKDALWFLRKCGDACARHPAATFSVNW